MNKLMQIVAAGLLAMAPLSVSAQDYKAEYKLSSILPTAFPHGLSAQRWADLVAERTKGRINIKMYSTASLLSGDQAREFSAVRSGAIDLAVGNTLNWVPQVTELNLFNLPFLMPDYAAMDAIIRGRTGAELFKIIEAKGVKPLAWGSNGFRQIINSKRAIRSPADLAGLKIRVVGSPLFNDTYAALGANPTQMNWGDALSAVGTGAIDGLEVPVSVFKLAKLNEVGLNQLTIWNYLGGQLVFAVNPAVWDSWTAEDQEIVRAAASQAAYENLFISRQGIVPPDVNLLDTIRTDGVNVQELSDAEIAVFREATRGVYEEWSEKIGADLVNMAEEDVQNRY